MQFYNSQLDPELKKFTVSYTDTDSMHIDAELFEKLKKNGFIPDEAQLGYLSNDLKKKGDGIIIQEINLGAKMYMYKYINKNNEIGTVIKAKGMPKKYLTQKYF